MKHYTLRVTAPSPTWDSRQQLIVNLSKFKTNINMIRTYIVFSILRHVINSPVDNIFGRAVCDRSYNPTFGIFAVVVPGGGTPIHYLYGYVPPNGVVILKLLI